MAKIRDAVPNRDMSGYDFGVNDYIDCRFVETPMRNSHMEAASFIRCDFSKADIRRSVWRLACNMGSGNKIDVLNAAAFLYWFNHFFDLPPQFKSIIESMIAPYRRQLAVLFSEEL